jgi:hypothetical protein
MKDAAEYEVAKAATYLRLVDVWPEYWRVAFDERAAQLEYDETLPRLKAEEMAFWECRRRMKNLRDATQ